jgi:hypothetical protein
MKTYHPVLDKNIYRLTTISISSETITQMDVVRLLKKFVIRLPKALVLYLDDLKPDFFTFFKPEEIDLFKTVNTLFIRLPFSVAKETKLFLQSIVCFFPFLKSLTIYVDQVHTFTEKTVRVLYRKTRFDGYIPRFSMMMKNPQIVPTFDNENSVQRFCLPRYLIEEIDGLAMYSVCKK